MKVGSGIPTTFYYQLLLECCSKWRWLKREKEWGKERKKEREIDPIYPQNIPYFHKLRLKTFFLPFHVYNDVYKVEHMLVVLSEQIGHNKI